MVQIRPQWAGVPLQPRYIMKRKRSDCSTIFIIFMLFLLYSLSFLSWNGEIPCVSRDPAMTGRSVFSVIRRHSCHWKAAHRRAHIHVCRLCRRHRVQRSYIARRKATYIAICAANYFTLRSNISPLHSARPARSARMYPCPAQPLRRSAPAPLAQGSQRSRQRQSRPDDPSGCFDCVLSMKRRYALFCVKYASAAWK